jgi:ankyrin repeat protein
MKSIRSQLLVTLVATAVAAGFFIYRGLPPMWPTCIVAQIGDTEAVQRHIRWGVNVTTWRDAEETTVLHWAACSRHADVVELLLAEGIDVDARDSLGETPLHYVGDTSDVAALLIAGGANVNAKDIDGRTPLHSAVSHGYKDVVALLIAEGSDINAKDNSGDTPLRVALVAGHRQAAALLRRHGAKE